MSRPSPYPRELRERAVRMVAEVRPNYESEHAAIGAVAHKLGIGTAETLRKWVRQAEVDAGARAGVSTDESAELKRLRRENAELRRANEILKAASAFFAAELDRPAWSSRRPRFVTWADVVTSGRRWSLTIDPRRPGDGLDLVLVDPPGAGALAGQQLPSFQPVAVGSNARPALRQQEFGNGFPNGIWKDR